VERRRLLDRLDSGVGQRLVLVSAAPGYGKTALLADWVLSREQSLTTSWLTTDAGTNDASTLALRMADGLRRSLFPAESASLVHSAEADAADELLALADVVGRTGRPFVTVIDDYQAIEDPGANETLARLLSALPENWTVVIGTRREPVMLPLARLRASLELTELRAPDLAFTVDEAAEVVSLTAGRYVSRDVARLITERTEGWPAGVRLAGLRLCGTREDRAVAREFDGVHPDIACYFSSEVFEPLDPELREFLLLTSTLDEVSPAAAEALTGTADARRKLAELERRNAFLTPTALHGETYRYHRMFRQWLLSELRATEPDREAELRRRAAEMTPRTSREPTAEHAERRRARRGAGGAAPPLTGSELVVLECLAGDASLREIGTELYLSLNTVKSHTRSIYRKLGVGSREEALDRARESGLLDGSGGPP
jgi:LuxR family transcriptional regulator, maltose regulon positive regulatory protein